VLGIPAVSLIQLTTPSPRPTPCRTYRPVMREADPSRPWSSTIAGRVEGRSCQWQRASTRAPAATSGARAPARAAGEPRPRPRAKSWWPPVKSGDTLTAQCHVDVSAYHPVMERDLNSRRCISRACVCCRIIRGDQRMYRPLGEDELCGGRMSRPMLATHVTSHGPIGTISSR
jgi:hypothetical protein